MMTNMRRTPHHKTPHARGTTPWDTTCKGHHVMRHHLQGAPCHETPHTEAPRYETPYARGTMPWDITCRDTTPWDTTCRLQCAWHSLVNIPSRLTNVWSASGIAWEPYTSRSIWGIPRLCIPDWPWNVRLSKFNITRCWLDTSQSGWDIC